MRRLATASTTLALYAGLVVWLTWPLAAHLASRLPDTRPECRYDTLYMAWVLAHETHALTTAPRDLLDTNIYHPARRTLFYGDTGFGILPYFLPTFLLTGSPTVAINVAFLGCIALTAAALHLVVRRWTGSHLAGLVAAATLLTDPWVLWEFIPTAPSYAVLLYLPVIVLLAETDAPFLALLPLVVLQGLADVVYVAPAVLTPLGVLALGRLVRPRTRTAGLRLLGVLALAMVALLPVYAGHFAVWAANPGLARQTVWQLRAPPTALPWGPLVKGPTAIAPVALLLIMAGAASIVPRILRHEAGWPRRAWAHGALWAFVGTLISITPNASWSGRAVALPQHLLAQWVPIYRTLRDPERLGVAALFGLAILAGLAFAECVRRVPDRGRARPLATVAMAAGALGAMYAGYGMGGGGRWAGSYRLAPAITGDSPLIPGLRAHGGPLLELPVGAVSGAHGSAAELALPALHARAMYRSIFHWRPLLNGYSGYWPSGFEQRMALARRLPDGDALATLRRDTGLDAILVHLADFGGPEREVCGNRTGWCAQDFGAADRAAWRAVAAGDAPGDIRLVARDGDDLLFAVGPTRR